MYTIYKLTNKFKLKIMTVNNINNLFKFTETENFYLIDACVIKNNKGVKIMKNKKVSDNYLIENYIPLYIKDNFKSVKSALLYFYMQNKLFTMLNYEPLKIELLINKESFKYSYPDEIDIKDDIYNSNITFYRYFDGLKHTYLFDFVDFNVTISNDKLKKCLNFMIQYLNRGAIKPHI